MREAAQQGDEADEAWLTSELRSSSPVFGGREASRMHAFSPHGSPLSSARIPLLRRLPLKQTIRIVAVPLLISVALTLLRLAGELAHWSVAWFSPATGGILPSGWSWVVGITWLPALFGPYFAYRLWGAGHRPPNLILALGLALLGVAIVFFGMRAITPRLSTAAPFWLVAIWGVAVVAAGLQAFGWRKLAGTLLVYGLGSRAVVAGFTILLGCMAGAVTALFLAARAGTPRA
jgi:hypothetical protein